MTPAVVLGASGYVGGELLRLLALHNELRLAAAAARGAAGELVGTRFPHLAGVMGDRRFVAPEDLVRHLGTPSRLALFSALPHGEGGLLEETLRRLEDAGFDVATVDCSADLRFADARTWESVYAASHPAPGLKARAHFGLPELSEAGDRRVVSHPGCFVTAVTLGAAAMVAAGLVGDSIQASCVTGSTGSGREPKPGTHHPERHGNLRAYNLLGHRHRPEMEGLLAAVAPAGKGPRVLFAPHSGPFARGIHATLFMRLEADLGPARVLETLRAFHADHPFVSVQETPPSIKDVVATNRCILSPCVDGRDLVIVSVIDNLTKGAAGGAVQWMNRLLGLEETAGLALPGVGWN